MGVIDGIIEFAFIDNGFPTGIGLGLGFAWAHSRMNDARAPWMPRTRYRIVRGLWLCYAAEVRPWWFPVWMQIGKPTRSVDLARKICHVHKNPVVEEVDL